MPGPLHDGRTVLLLVALSLAPRSAGAQSTLCTKEEVTEWSCTAKGRTYSLCSSQDLGPAAGYLQYRVGTRSRREFAFPDPPRHPRGVFHLGLRPRGVSLEFVNDGYAYAIDEPLSGPTRISVGRDHREVSSVTCGSATETLTLTTTLDRFGRLGLDR